MEKSMWIICLAMTFVTAAEAHNSYTGGYSGTSGTKVCASACHGGTSGTIQVSGFPSSYVPGQEYTVTITHNGGNRLVNVNATTRLGSTTAVAGTFTASSNSAVYGGADGGIYVTPHLIDAIAFKWKAPAAGSGSATLFVSGYQATSTGSASGQSSRVSITASEVTTGAAQSVQAPRGFMLLQNYPNPFNPETTISFSVPQSGYATVKVFNVLGQEVATLFRGIAQAGSSYTVTFNAGKMASGIYFSRLECAGGSIVQKMILAK